MPSYPHLLISLVLCTLGAMTIASDAIGIESINKLNDCTSGTITDATVTGTAKTVITGASVTGTAKTLIEGALIKDASDKVIEGALIKDASDKVIKGASVTGTAKTDITDAVVTGTAKTVIEGAVVTRAADTGATIRNESNKNYLIINLVLAIICILIACWFLWVGINYQ